MKNFIIVILSLLLSTSLFAAGSDSSSSGSTSSDSNSTDPYIRWVDLGSIFHEMGPESAKMTFETTPGRKISFRIDLDHSRGPKHL
mgnify:CR=1 FL=1